MKVVSKTSTFTWVVYVLVAVTLSVGFYHFVRWLAS